MNIGKSPFGEMLAIRASGANETGRWSTTARFGAANAAAAWYAMPNDALNPTLTATPGNPAALFGPAWRVDASQATAAGNAHAKEIVFIDSGIRDFQAVLDGVKPGVRAVVLDSAQDALHQIARALYGHHDIAAIHVVADGTEGQIDFSSGALTLGGLDAHAHDLAVIGSALAPKGDLMLWGCNTGAGDAGQAFIGALAHATGADVAASIDLTGAAALGGDWMLEAHTGHIEASVPLTQSGMDNFGSVLVAGVAGQLWVGFGGAGDGGGGNPDGISDFRIEHVDSNGLADTYVIQQHAAHSSGTYSLIGLDTTANLSFSVDGSYNFRVTNLTTGADLSSVVIASHADGDLFGSFVVDAKNNVIYADLFGYDYTQANPAPYGGTLHGADIIKITYNPATGTISSPYIFNDGSATGSVNANSILINGGSTGNVYANARALQLSADGGTLYYIDCNNNDPSSFWGFSTNGIYKVSTSGTVGGGNAPTPVLLSNQAQFPVNDSNGYLTGMEIDEAKGVIYFTTNSNQPNVDTTQDAIWWMPIGGGSATKMTIPAGVNVKYPTFYGDALTLDVASQQLYYSDNQTGLISRFTLSADGHSFTSGATFAEIDTNGGYDFPGRDTSYPNDILFDDLPVLGAVTGTSTMAVQGGSAITLITATPTMSDPDGFDLSGGTVTITNAQTGDVLAANTAGTSITASYNTSTHKLTLSGEDTYAHYQQVFNSITYQDTGTDFSTGSHPTRTLTWVILDGITVVHPSTADPNERQTTVVIDRAPTLTNDNFAVLESATVTGTSGTAGTGVLGNDTDKDADAITVTAVQGSGANVGNSVAGTYGHLTLNANGSYSYNADNVAAINAAPNGSHPVDTFTYTVSDGLGGVTTTIVSFTIDRAPTVVADNPAGEGLESGAAATGNVLTNDSDKDGDSLTVSAVAGSGANVGNSIAGTYGHMTINSNGSYSYSADNAAAIDGAATGSHLTDTFTYTANDGHGGTTSTSITVTVDRAPTVVSDAPASQAVESGPAVTGNVLTNDSDRDGDTLSVSAVAGSGGNVGNSVATTYGHMTINANGSYSYSADNTVTIDAAATGAHLTDTVSYTSSDGLGGTTTTNIVVTLDRPPTVVADTDNVAEGGTVSQNAAAGVLADDSDRDGDSPVILSFSDTRGGGGAAGATLGYFGDMTLNADGSYTFIANNTAHIDAEPNGSHPVDVFNYVASDGHGGTTQGTLTVTIDRPATAAADSVSTFENATAVSGSGGNVNVLGNDQDKDGDAIVVTAVNGSGANVGTQIALASGALLTLNADGTYTYDPNHAFDDLPSAASGASNASATDTFTYTIDGGSTVTVTVTVNGVDSNDTLIGTLGNDTMDGGIGADSFLLAKGGDDTAQGGIGDDTFRFGAHLTAADQVTGGDGEDRIVLAGDYSTELVFGAATMTGVERIKLVDGHDYNLATDDANVAAGETLTVYGSTLGAGDSLVFDGSAETDGRFALRGGAGADTLAGGARSDHLDGAGGADLLTGGGGRDTFVFHLGEAAGDTVVDFDGTHHGDHIEFVGYGAGATFNQINATQWEVVSGDTLTHEIINFSNAAVIDASDYTFI